MARKTISVGINNQRGNTMKDEELKSVIEDLEMYELALKGWEYLTVDQEQDCIKNIIRLRKEKEKLLRGQTNQPY